MSDSLKGQVPELEDETQNFDDAFVVSALELNIDEKSEIFVGNLIGISLEEIIKIDLRLNLSSAYKIIKSQLSGSNLFCEAFQLHLSDDLIRHVGPFKILSRKMIDIDHPNKMCTLALDLVREG